MRYTVYQPVTNARWQRSAEYWQLVLEYKNAEAADGSLKILISLENQNQKEKPFDYLVRLENGSGKVFDAEENFITDVEYYALNDGSQIKFRIPLSDKGLQKVLGAKRTYHTIVMEGEPSGVEPLEVTMEPRKKNKKEEAETKAFVNHVKEFYYQTQEAGNNDIDERLSYYGSMIKENPEDYVSLSNYGAYLAMKGGQSSIMKATALVNESYEYLNKACQLAFNKPGEIEVLLNRASVSASVPEQVFGKALGGAEDFKRIILLSDDEIQKAYCYVMAYECYKKCGKESLAFLSLQEAKKMVE